MRLTAAIFMSSASAFSLKYHTTFCTTSLLLVPFGMHTRTRLNRPGFCGGSTL